VAHTENPSFFLYAGLADLRGEIGWCKVGPKMALGIKVPEPLDQGSDLCLIADRQARIKRVRDDARPDFSVDDPGARSRRRRRVPSRLERPDPADRLQEGIVS
jgi:hypothetical protein